MAAAQTFYKWTDDQGIVHFADMPPPKSEHVEERHLPPPPVGAPATTEGEAAPATGAEGSTPAPAAGPARVVLVSQQTPRTGPSGMHVFGEVKNVGGQEAQRVAVTISSVDSTAGTPCLSEETAVTPSTLHPGESGKFDVDLDNPCLSGEARVDIAPVWD
jgi:hypothetical protein